MNNKLWAYFWNNLFSPLIAGIVAGLVAGLILNSYQSNNDITKVKVALKSEIKSNLKKIDYYLDEINSYNPHEKKDTDIYKLQNIKLQSIAFRSISSNVSLLDEKIIEKVFGLYHTYTMIQEMVPYNLMPLQDKPIDPGVSYHPIVGEAVWQADPKRAKEILKDKKKLIELAKKDSLYILNYLHH